MTKTQKSINHLIKKLKTDKEYRRSWQANIAMSYIDNYNWHKNKTGKKSMNQKDRHTIANDAADYFLNLLCS